MLAVKDCTFSFNPEPTATACRTERRRRWLRVKRECVTLDRGQQKPLSARTVRAKYRRIVGIPDQTGQEKLFGTSAGNASSRSTRPSLAAATEPGKTFFQTDNAP